MKLHKIILTLLMAMAMMVTTPTRVWALQSAMMVPSGDSGDDTLMETCPYCKGNGHELCPACNGTRLAIIGECSSCDGGYINCTECSGRGHKDAACAYCDGKGGFDIDDSWEECTSCDGTGEDEVTCSKCLGSGSVSCDKCENGYIIGTCTSCEDGHSTTTCSYCSGTGTIVNLRLPTLTLKGGVTATITDEGEPWVATTEDETLNKLIVDEEFVPGLRSNNINQHKTSSTMTINLFSIKDFRLSFNAYCNGEAGYDKLTIYVDGQHRAERHQNIPRYTYCDTLTAGTHSVKLTYSKDGAVSSGYDCGFIYDFEAVAVASNSGSAFNVAITKAGDDEPTISKEGANRVAIYNSANGKPQVAVLSGSEEATPTVFEHNSRYDFALTALTSIKPGEDDLIGDIVAKAPRRLVTRSEPTLTGPALVVITASEAITYPLDASHPLITLGMDASGNYTVNGTKPEGTVTDIYFLDPHQPTKTEGVSETCTTAGNSAYYYCSLCDKYFSDEACEHEIEEDSWIIPAGHKLTAHEAQDADGCSLTGNTAYWSCTVCGKCFGDENCEHEIEEGSWIIPAADHTIEGNSNVCTVCHKQEVEYIAADGTTQKAWCNVITQDNFSQYVTAGQYGSLNIASDWYAISGDVVISGPIYFNGQRTMNLILTDGSSFVDQEWSIRFQSPTNIFGQKGNTGRLEVVESSDNYIGFYSTANIYGGNFNSEAWDLFELNNDTYIKNANTIGTITLSSGNLTIDGGTHTYSERFLSRVVNAYNGSITLNGGTFTAPDGYSAFAYDMQENPYTLGEGRICMSNGERVELTFDSTNQSALGHYQIILDLDGDTNLDGQLSIADLTCLISYLGGNKSATTSLKADVNGDGSVNLNDVISLRNLLLDVK